MPVTSGTHKKNAYGPPYTHRRWASMWAHPLCLRRIGRKVAWGHQFSDDGKQDSPYKSEHGGNRPRSFERQENVENRSAGDSGDPRVNLGERPELEDRGR